MAKPINVLLSFIHGRLEKMRAIGAEHSMTTAQGTLKNATIVMNIVNFIIDLRHDDTINKIIEKEGVPLLPLIQRTLTQYAASKGYFTGKSNKLP